MVDIGLDDHYLTQLLNDADVTQEMNSVAEVCIARIHSKDGLSFPLPFSTLKILLFETLSSWRFGREMVDRFAVPISTQMMLSTTYTRYELGPPASSESDSHC